MDVVVATSLDAHEHAVWRRALEAAAPEFRWLDANGGEDAASAEAAVVANPYPGALAGLPKLRLIQSLWAGVDRLLADPNLPRDVPIARMVDPMMTRAMVQTALWATLSLHRGFFAYAQQQGDGQWQQRPQRRAGQVFVLVLGRGEMGSTVASALVSHGYRVLTWRRGEPLGPLLPNAEIVINLLPLTDETRGLLDEAFFARLPRGASIVNLARGAHVVDADLLAALDSGRLAHAVLDVFSTEPLPAGHAYWRHPRVTVLPHVAALTDERSAAKVVAANLRALRDGRPLVNLVDPGRGY